MKHLSLLFSISCTMCLLFDLAAAGRGDNVPQTPPAAQPATVTAPESGQDGIVDDGAPGWIWNGMDEYDDPSLKGGSGHAGGPGGYGAYTFHGSEVEVYGMAAPTIDVDGQVHGMGRARLLLDGKLVGTVSDFKSSPQYGYRLFDVTGLSDGNHVLQVEADRGWIVVDYLRVIDPDRQTAPSTVDDKAASKSGAPAEKPADQPPSAAGPTIPGGYYKIELRTDIRKLLSVHTLNPANGSFTEVDTESRDRMQVWQVTPLSGGKYRISPASSPELALAVLSQMIRSVGYAVGTWSYADNPSCQWNLIPVASGFYEIESVGVPGYVVDLLFADDTDGSNLDLFNFHGGNSQEWAFAPVSQ